MFKPGKMFTMRESDSKFAEPSPVLRAQKENEITPDKIQNRSKDTKLTRKRKRWRSSNSLEDEIDTTIDGELEQKASNYNLSEREVKKILTKVVKNEHVLAIVKLKEEKLDREEQAMKQIRENDQNSDSRNRTDNVSDTTTTTTTTTIEMDDSITDIVPKLTRAKAKELNTYPLPVAPLKKSDSEVAALIHEELHSDDDDEEYQPGEDDIESDDDINTTTSDIDSQPATPSSQIDMSQPRTPIYTDDGLFKIPRIRNDSIASQLEQEYSIAKQTRSKISYAETPIELIEATFNAPDVTNDMYPDVFEMDPDWTEFLFSCMNPTSAAELEKDEEDPDYFPKTPDGQIYDREEYQPANVPKRELKTLRDDLYEWLSFSDGFDDPLITIINTNSKPIDPIPSTSANLNDSLITPVKFMPDPIMLNITAENITDTDTTMQSPQIQNNSTNEYFNPKIISTPARPDLLYHSSDFNNQCVSYPTIELPTFSNQPSFTDGNNVSYFVGNETLGPQPFNPITYSPFKLVTFAPNAVEPSNNNVFTVPPMIMTTTAMPSTIITPTIAINYAPILPAPENVERSKTRLGCRSKRSRFKGAKFSDLDTLDPNSIIANQVTFPPNAHGFTDAQRLILERQLRIHVQLSTQTYLQTYGHPRLYHRANQFKKNLLELREIVEKEGANPVSICNLKPALELIESWEHELEADTPENGDLIEFIRDQLDKMKNNNAYKMRFHDRILHKICTSKVFLYPDYLPSTPFQVDVKKSEYIPSEDYMIAFLLEHFFNELNAKMIKYKFAKQKIVNLTDVCKHISAHLNYIRQPKSIYDYVRLRRKQDIMNPIKYYFTHNIAPPYNHTYEIFRESMAIEPAKQPVSTLPPQFANYACKLNCEEYSKELYRFNIAALTQSPKKRKVESKETPCTPITTKIYNKENILDGESVPISLKERPSDSQVKVKILYEPFIDTKSKQNDETIQYELPKGQTLLTSFFKVQQKPSKTETREIKEYDDFGPTEPINGHEPSHERPNNLLLHRNRNRILRKYCKLNKRNCIVKKRLQRCLVLIIRDNKEQTTRHWRQYSHNTKLLYVYQCILIYHQFTSAVLAKQFESDGKMTTDTIMINRRVQRILNESPNNGREHNDDNHLGSNVCDAGTKRLSKNQRNANDNNLLMLLTENTNESSEKDYLFAQHFIDRVEETFANDNLYHKFTEFLNILRVFNENQSKRNGADLYLTLEKLFLPDHPELADMFLLFLTPSDAIEIGKFMDHFFQTNFTKFISKLNIFFQKQPAQIRKVLACVKELSEEPDVSFDRIRSRIIPLLKGNQLLIDWFSQCIGPDKCDGSKDEYETLDLRKSHEMDGDDVGETYEYIPQNEIVSDPNDNPCHVRFINGRLFYGNRITIPAKLSFGVSPCVSPSKYPSEIDRTHLIGGQRDKMHQYHCVHNIKQFGDISKMHAEFDQMGNSVSLDDIENSDDEQPHCMLSPSDKSEEKHHSFDEDTENSATYGPDQMLCDDTLLRAHSIRLNPSSHAHMFPANIELLNKLKQPHSNDIASSDTNTKELKLSPKKQATLKCLTNIIQPKIPQVRKNLSPNGKSVGSCKSPNGKKAITSPQSNIHPSASPIKEPNPSESNAIQTAKKLKRMLEPNASGQLAESDDIQAHKKPKKIHSIVKPFKKQKRLTEQDGNVEQVPIGSETVQPDTIADYRSECTKTSQPSPPPLPLPQQTETIDNRDDISPKCETKITWTSDEDRVLLEQIKNGFDFSDESILKMAQRFPNKTSEHIRERVDFLIDFIMNRT